MADAVAHLGYVQIDTINVIERCHHHILYTRIPAYRRADLRQAQSADKSVFEYWTHALSYVPSRDFRFFMPDMRLHKREGHRWFANVKPADTRKVMRLLKGGALTIRDIEDDVLTEKEHLWASRKPSKRALQLAFYCGTVTVSERNGMLKTYELIGPPFRLGQAAEIGDACRGHGLSARPRAALAGRGVAGFDLSSRCAEQEGRAATRSIAGCAAASWCRSRSTAPASRSIGPRLRCSRPGARRRRRWCISSRRSIP